MLGYQRDVDKPPRISHRSAIHRDVFDEKCFLAEFAERARVSLVVHFSPRSCVLLRLPRCFTFRQDSTSYASRDARRILKTRRYNRGGPKGCLKGSIQREREKERRDNGVDAHLLAL